MDGASRLRVVALAAIVVAGALSTREDAWAGTVEVAGDRIVFTAGTSEVNAVTVGTFIDGESVPDGPVVTVLDAGAPVVAGPGCEIDPAGAARCEDLTHLPVELRLHDGDDQARTADYFLVGHPLLAFGGDGNDRISAGSGGGAISPPLLDGGRGDDEIVAALNFGGGVNLAGGPGDDRLTAFEVGPPSRLAGGPGRDEIDYGGLVNAEIVTVQLDGGRGHDVFRLSSEPFEPRVITAGRGFDSLVAQHSEGISFDMATCPDCELESVVGTPFDDVLLGDDDGNLLDGGAGNDAIDPRGGRDAVDGGPGADQLVTRDGRRDLVRCGDDVDTLTADRRDRVAVDCESVMAAPF